MNNRYSDKVHLNWVITHPYPGFKVKKLVDAKVFMTNALHEGQYEVVDTDNSMCLTIYKDAKGNVGVAEEKLIKHDNSVKIQSINYNHMDKIRLIYKYRKYINAKFFS